MADSADAAGDAAQPPFAGFWIAGFEGADHRNGSGLALDLAQASGHLQRLDADHASCARFGFAAVRESVGWRLAETTPGRHDFSRARAVAASARRHGLQVLWSLMHYGMPHDLHVLHPHFVPRLAAFAAAAARALRPHDDERAAVYTPINEIGYLAWVLSETGAVAAGPARGPAADSRRSGWSLKCRLVQAALAAMAAIRDVDPRARFLHVEPLVHVAAPVDRPDLAAEAEAIAGYQWQAWDLLAGRLEPSLGGTPAALDLLGLNHYHSGQWEVGSERRLAWHLRDPRRRPFAELAEAAWRRYGRPMIVAETSHFGAGRAAWLDDIAAEVDRARRRGVPLHGLTLYPIVDRPDWDRPGHWHHSGLWDAGADDPTARVLCRPYAKALRRWQRRLPLPKAPTMSTLIVFSHLRWDFVFQRPQHLLSRLARHHHIVFIEEPVHDDTAPPHFERLRPAPDVLVLRPHTPVPAAGFHDDQLRALKPLLARFMKDEAIGEPLVWFYTPMALPLLAGLRPRAVIYDCMDELSAFKGAPRQMRQRETALLKAADLVLTGGPSLYQAKRGRHDNVHCLPSAVDAAHFAPARITANCAEYLAAEQLQGHILAPRLGWFGVIDERLDLALVAALADADPHWHVVMVGPVVKIDPASLPQRPNLHWLGHQPYTRLPALVAAWDVCLLPFALSEHTRFISPTKTLEYLAAEKPVVATAVADVVGMYGEVVHVAHDRDAFVAACRALLVETPSRRARRLVQSAASVSRFSWDEAARTVQRLIEHAAEHAVGRAAHRPALPELASVERPVAAPRAVRHLVIGAGPTGLAAAYYLGQKGKPDTLLVERENRVGGYCRSTVDRGFTFDQAGHIMFSDDAEVQRLYRLLLGDNMHWQQREAWIYSKGVHTRYPFQGALHGLPAEVLKECIVGAIEARFGPLGRDGGSDAAPRPPPPPPANFLEFIHRTWGAGIAKHFAVPYNEKLWAVPLDEMETSWLGGRVPLPDLAQMIAGALEPVPAPMGPNARFGYPLRGGFQALMDGFLPHLQAELALNTRVLQVSPAARTVLLDDGRTLQYGTLISTMPLPQLVAACGDEAPPDVQAAAKALRHVNVRCVNLGVGRERLSDKHWIYYPEDTVFHRLFMQGNASPHNNAPGGFALTAEISYSAAKPLPCDGDALVDRVVADCRRVGLLREDDPLHAVNQTDMPCAYVVYDHARAAHVATIRGWMARHGIVLAGRYAEWEYYNSDHAFIAGRKAAEQALAAQADGTAPSLPPQDPPAAAAARRAGTAPARAAM